MNFTIQATDPGSAARAGALVTDHGEIQTPMFMPVGTHATVKGVAPQVLEKEIAAQIILANTYHLFLRPGAGVISEAGGLHAFMSWQRPILTDSGGYQVYSLSNMRKISEEGVEFRSHIDGSSQFLSPESAVDVQRKLGADIIMAFDECTPYPCEKAYAETSMHLTHRWLDRCCVHDRQTPFLYGYEQVLVPIVQGSTYPDLRKQSAEYIARAEQPINAIGGLSVGEPAEEMYAMTDTVCEILPRSKPRYLMGVGTPQNLLECIGLGIDMFDCVLPSRNARHGLLYTWDGIMNMRNEKWKKDFSPLDTNGSDWSKRFSKAYLRHLILSNEMLGASIATVHNLAFFLDLVHQSRKHIVEGTYSTWKASVVDKLGNRL